MRLTIALVLVALFLAGCGQGQQQQAATQPPPKLPPNMKFGYQPPTTTTKQ